MAPESFARRKIRCSSGDKPHPKLAFTSRRAQDCGGLFSRWRSLRREEAPGLMSPQMLSARGGQSDLKRTPSPQPPRDLGGWETADAIVWATASSVTSGYCEWQAESVRPKLFGGVLPRFGPARSSRLRFRRAALHSPRRSPRPPWRSRGSLAQPSRTRLEPNSTPDILWKSRGEYHILLFYQSGTL